MRLDEILEDEVDGGRIIYERCKKYDQVGELEF
jgi:hypothetical protein